MRKGFAVIGSSLALMALASIPASAVTFDRFVNPSGTCDPALIAGKPTHLTIQEAVNAALVNETIGPCLSPPCDKAFRGSQSR